MSILSTRVNPAQSNQQDSGMSTVELIIAMVISALVLGLIATIFGQGLGAQQQAAERNSTTARATAQTTLFNEITRDAIGVWFSGARDEVRAKVIADDGAVRCQAWYVDPAPNSTSVLAHKEWDPAAAVASTWTTLDENALFTADPAVPAGADLAYTARSANAPTFKLEVFADGDRDPATTSVSTITLRPLKLVADAGGACW